MDPARILDEILRLPREERLVVIREILASLTTPEDAARILEEVLPLPPEQRGAVVDQLLSSLEAPIDSARENKWLVEVERRWHAIEAGTEDTVDQDEALEFAFAPPHKKAV